MTQAGPTMPIRSSGSPSARVRTTKAATSPVVTYVSPSGAPTPDIYSEEEQLAFVQGREDDSDSPNDVRIEHSVTKDQYSSVCSITS